MRGLALVIEAVNVVLKHLAQMSDGPEVRELRDEALGCINEAVLWKDEQPRPTVQQRDTLMKKVLALHIAANKLDARRRSASAARTSSTCRSPA